MDTLAAEEVLVADIQRFSLHDGPGIRTTVFLKGCDLRCLWCQNPETVKRTPEIAFFAERCEFAKWCAVCPVSAISFTDGPRIDYDQCTACGLCAAACPHGALRLIGRRMGVEELEHELLKDRPYFEDSGGGVTFSGGEPMLQAPFLAVLLPRLSLEGIHIAMQTCGAFAWSRMEDLIGSLDLIYFDLKHMDRATHRRITGSSNQHILSNFAKLADSEVTLVARMPVIPGFNDDRTNVSATARFLLEHSHSMVHLLGYHRLGEAKKPRLNATLAPFEHASVEHHELEQARRDFAEDGIDAVVCH